MTPSASGLALLFAAGARPCADDVARLLAAPAGNDEQTGRIVHAGDGGDDPAEVLASGLTFDLAGLAPALAGPLPDARHFFGIPANLPDERLEAIVLEPGRHIAAGPALMPVVRVMCGLAARLTGLAGVKAVCWRPASSWIEPGYFARVVGAWLAGGAFPALGLAAFRRTADGGLESEGLAYFIGRELRVEALPGEDAAATARIAVRAADMLVRSEPIEEPRRIGGLGSETLLIEPEGERQLRLWRGA